MAERDIIREVWDLFSETIGEGEFRLFLFGSRASHTNTPHADFDFLVRGPKPVPADRWKIFLRKLDRLRTLYSIDVVDYQLADREFQEIVTKSEMKEIRDGQIVAS